MDKRVTKFIKLFIINAITSIRFIGAFILPYIYFKYGVGFASNFIIILFISDSIDGLLARVLNCSTFFGSALDASSDKLLNVTSFIILGLEYNIMFCPLLIEIAILYTAYNTYRYGGNVQSTTIGKIKTIILDLFVVLSFILLSLPTFNINNPFILKVIDHTNIIIHIFAFIVLIACLVALFDYLSINKEARLNPKSKQIKYEVKNKKPFRLVISNLFDTSYYLEHKNESIAKQFYIN